MEFVEKTRKYFIGFYFLGILPSLPEGILSHILISSVTQKVLMIIHATIGLSLTFSLMISAMIRNRDTVYYGRTEMPIISMVAICEILRVIFILIQCIFHKHVISEIFSDFQKFETFFAVHFRHNIRYKALNKTFFNKVMIVAFACLQYNCLLTLRILILNNFPHHGIEMNKLRALAAATLLHVNFYIDTLGFYLDQINNVIENDKHTATGQAITVF